ncbi:MAG: flippase [Chloroflexi bacterium]|nr:MAG: flippase [Chloroflexota bacterium]
MATSRRPRCACLARVLGLARWQTHASLLLLRDAQYAALHQRAAARNDAAALPPCLPGPDGRPLRTVAGNRPPRPGPGDLAGVPGLSPAALRAGPEQGLRATRIEPGSSQGGSYQVGFRRLVGNTVWNLAGQILPLAVGAVAVPILIRRLGVDRFGILTLAWLISGYLSLFDFGLGRALTKSVAEFRARGQGDIQETVWTSLALLLGAGLVGAALIWAAAPYLAYHLLRIDPSLQLETMQAFQLLALTIPLVTLASGLRGVLEGLQRFDLVNLVRIPGGALTFLGPVAAMALGPGLVPAIWSLVLMRVFMVLLFAVLTLRVLGLGRRPALAARRIGPLMSFGGWLTVSNVVGPIMVSIDRPVIATMVSVAAVAYYATPYEVATKLWLVPAALTPVLFPAFAAALTDSGGRAADLFSKGVRYTLLALWAPVLALVILARPLLALWLGPAFADHSYFVLQMIALGVFINSLAYMPSALIQATGRPDLTAGLHVLQVVPYVVGLLFAIQHWGIDGAAVVWCLRAALDAVLLFALAAWLLRLPGHSIRMQSIRIGLGVAGAAIGLLPAPDLLRLGFLVFALLAGTVVAWNLMLEAPERLFIRRRWRPALPSPGGE